jgi:HEAT repeat protein
VPLDPELRDTARREIIEAARGGQVEERVHGLEAIRAANLADGIPEILDGLRDPEPVVRFAAALAAGELRVRDAQPILLDIVYDPSGSVRAAVRFALHRLGDTRFSHDLENLSQDPQPIVRSNAAMVLGLLGEKSAAKILRPMLKDPVFAVREQAAEALWRLGDEEGLEELIGLSISAHPDDQMIGLLALAEPRDQNVRQHIRGALVVVDRGGEASGYTECALVAARAMGMLGRDEGYGIALQGAASKDPRQRQLAAFAFGAIGRSDSQPILSNLLHDEDRDVRIAAAAAIFQLH